MKYGQPRCHCNAEQDAEKNEPHRQNKSLPGVDSRTGLSKVGYLKSRFRPIKQILARRESTPCERPTLSHPRRAVNTFSLRASHFCCNAPAHLPLVVRWEYPVHQYR